MQVVTQQIHHISRNCSSDANGKGLPELHRAAIANHLQRVDALLCSGLSSVDLKDQFGNTALHYAVIYGHVNMVVILVSKFNADIYLPCLTIRLFKEVNIENCIELARFHGNDNIEMWLVWNIDKKVKWTKEDAILRNTFLFTSVWCTGMLVVGFWFALKRA